MIIRSRESISAIDLSLSKQRLRLTFRSFLLNTIELSTVLLSNTVTESLNAVEKKLKTSHVDYENFALKIETTSARTNFEILIKNQLKQEIERCKKIYREKNFIVNDDERSKTVYSDEINVFFSRFQEGTWLSNVNLMSLLFSFQWSSTILVLHSFYMSFKILKMSSQSFSNRVRWSLRHEHDRIILSCCNEVYWTLYNVDLVRKLVRHYDFLTEDIFKSEKVIFAIKERLSHVMKKWKGLNLNFIVVSRVSDILVLFYTVSIQQSKKVNCLTK